MIKHSLVHKVFLDFFTYALPKQRSVSIFILLFVFFCLSVECFLSSCENFVSYLDKNTHLSLIEFYTCGDSR